MIATTVRHIRGGFAGFLAQLRVCHGGLTRSLIHSRRGFSRLIAALVVIFIGLSPVHAQTSTALTLAPGWHLLGNGYSSPIDVSTAFGDSSKISTVWKWLAAKTTWAFYSPLLTGPALANYAASKGYDVLTSIDGGEGFWINASAAFPLSLPTGNAVNSQSFQSLASGWHIIAIGDNKTPRAFNSALSGMPPIAGCIPTNIITLWAWDNTRSNWYFYAPSLDSNGSLSAYIAGKGYLDFGSSKTLDDKTGFWVNKVDSGAGNPVVPLTLAAAPAALSVPVKTGVPFPMGCLQSLSNARLESGDGSQQIPAQFDTLASWPDGSIKSALVQFVTDVGAAKSYRVAFGAGITRTPMSAGVSVVQAAGDTTVDTGVIKYLVNAKGLITSLWRDANHDGQFGATEQVLGAGEFFMVNAFDNVEYTASQATAPDIAVEEQGPVRAVIRARGSLTNASGTALIKYQVRYYAYAGSDKLDIDFTVIDDRLESNVQSPGTTLALSAKSYGLRWSYLSDSAAQYRFGLEASAVASGTVSGEHYLMQNGQFIFDNGVDKGNSFAYSGVASGLHAPGWVALDSGARHLALMVRDFWQQYPIELNVKGNMLTAALFTGRAISGAVDTTLPAQSGTRYQRPNSFYFLRPGGAKTHQMRLAFGDTSPTSPTLDQLNSGYQRHRLELTADPSWYAASGVFGDINVGSSTTASTGYDAMLLNDIYIRSIEQPSADSVGLGDPPGGDATMFGWRDYGDRLRAGWNNVVNGVRIPAFYNDTHVGANSFFHEFVRTGEQRWFELGEISTRHFADIDVHHGPRKGYWDAPAVWSAMGQQPAGEIHAISHNNEDHDSRNLHWGHAHVSGLSDLYLLTGDKRSLEVLTEIGNWWRFVTPYFFKTPFDAAQYREAERDYAWPLYAMNEYVRVTGDATYHKTVNGQLVNYLIQWWQTPLNHIGYNPLTNTVSNAVIGINDASKGTGYWTMTLMDNSNGTTGTGTNPWMAGPLLSSVIKFYEQDKLMAASGKGAGVSYATIEDMLFQCMNYVVKYGYDATNDWFVYSEVTRNYSGGHTMIDYALAYLDRLYKQKLAAAQIAHPEWYDTQPTWSVIAKKRYDEFLALQVGANTQSYGFYGYEMVYPIDFFNIMAGP